MHQCQPTAVTFRLPSDLEHASNTKSEEDTALPNTVYHFNDSAAVYSCQPIKDYDSNPTKIVIHNAINVKGSEIKHATYLRILPFGLSSYLMKVPFYLHRYIHRANM